MKDFHILTPLKGFIEEEKTEEGCEKLRMIFESLVFFLQNNNLTTRKLLSGKGTIEDEFKLMRSDVTELGFKVLQQTLTKWLDKVSSSKSQPDNISMLEKKLKVVMEQQKKSGETKMGQP